MRSCVVLKGHSPAVSVSNDDVASVNALRNLVLVALEVREDK